MLTLRPGFVTEEFIELTRRENWTVAQERRLTAMRTEMAQKVMGAPAGDVYEIASPA